MYGSPSRFIDAARLLKRAAKLRGEDPRAATNFRSAAWMYSAAGQNSSAREMMELAAERSLVVGDVEQAATSFIDAAELALASGREDKVPLLIRRARAAVKSPLIAER